MNNDRYPKILLEGNVDGKRPRGRPGKRWIEDIRQCCEDRNIPSVSAAGHLASNREQWRLIVTETGKPSPGLASGGRL